MNLIYILVTIQLFALTAESHNKIVFCYYASWNAYRNPDYSISLDNIDGKLCTHLGYAYFDVSEDGTVIKPDKWTNLMESFELMRSNSSKSNLKTILVIGHPKYGAKKFSNIIKKFEYVQRFIETAISIMDIYNFDGLEIDWEYPYDNVIESKENFIHFLQMIKILLQFKNYTLSVAVAAQESKAKIFYDIFNMQKYVDFINLKTYDFYNHWSRKTGFYSPLEDSNSDNIMATVNYWIDNGVPLNKLILGISFYGRTFKLKDKSDNGVGAAILGTGVPGNSNQKAGVFTYLEICQKIQNYIIYEKFDETTKSVYALNERLWITYENQRSLYYKIAYVKNMTLGGVMIWSIDADDFAGVCGTKFQLMHFIKDALNNDRVISFFKSFDDKLFDSPDIFLCPGPGLYPTKFDCEKFHVCAEAGDTQTMIMSCPPGLVFDDRIGKCNWPALVNCTTIFTFE